MLNFITGGIGNGKRLIVNGLILNYLIDNTKVIIIEHGNRNYDKLLELIKSGHSITNEVLVLDYTNKDEMMFLKEMLKAAHEHNDEKVVVIFDDIRSVTDDLITECVSFLVDKNIESYLLTDTTAINDKLMHKISSSVANSSMGEIKASVFNLSLSKVEM